MPPLCVHPECCTRKEEQTAFPIYIISKSPIKPSGIFLLSLRLEDVGGKIEIVGGPTIHLKKEEEGSGSFFIVLPSHLIHERKTSVRLGLYEGNKKIDVIRTNFMGPVEDSDSD